MTDAEWKRLLLDSVNRLEKRFDGFDTRLGNLEKLVAQFDANYSNCIADVCGHQQTLYGPDGRGGLTADFQTLKHRQVWWYRFISLASAGISAIIGALAAWLKFGKP